MKQRASANLSASVHQLLLNAGGETHRPFNELLQYYAMERFLYRLSKSPYAARFTLKGALMLAAWKLDAYRPTMDIDLLGKTGNQVESVVAITKEICNYPVAPDGLEFLANTVQGERIMEHATYEGVRIRFRAHLGAARITLQLDVGFGDVVVPAPRLIDYPTLLDFDAPRLRGYSKESLIAEKLESMVTLGVLNSRMKDYFDVWTLSRRSAFSGRTIANAIAKTFANRGTKMVPAPVGLTSEFVGHPAKQSQWLGFIRKSRVEAPPNLVEVITDIARFLNPIVAALSAGKQFRGDWIPPGPWMNEEGAAVAAL